MMMVQPELAAGSTTDPAPILAEFCRTYQFEGVADRVVLTTTDSQGQEQSLEIVLQRTTTDTGTLTRIDFPEVSFYHTQGVLTAERAGERNHAVVYLNESAGDFLEALAAVAPAWPMPQLWVVQDDGSVIDPALGRIMFTAADVRDTEILLTGSSSAGTVTLVIDPETHRGLWFGADLRDGKIRCDYSRIQREDPASWAITTQGRLVVSRLAQLALSGPPISVGETLNDLDLLTPDYEGISLSELQSIEQVRRSGPWVVLLILKADADQTVFDLAGAVASGLWSGSAREIAALNENDVLRYWLGHRTILVAVTPDLDILPARMDSIASRAPIGVPMLVSTEPEHTLDRLETESSLVAVLVDPHRTVGAVVSIETAETGISAVLDAMRSYTRKDAGEEPEGPLVGSD